MTTISRDFLFSKITNNENLISTIDFQQSKGKAAVLIPFFWKDDEWHILFIRRTKKTNDPHSGQVAFPGGHVEESDKTLEETALREFEEETGIPKTAIEVIGQMPSSLSITDLEIIPFVGILKTPFDPTPQEDEVARIFSIPYDFLQSQNQVYQKKFTLPNGHKRASIFYRKYDNEILWGLSARIMNNLTTILK